MKIRSLAILSMFVMGTACTYADDSEGMMGHHHMMVEHLFGDKNEITKEEYVKHFTDKFDEIDEDKTGKITKDQAIEFFKAKWKKHMQEKFCNK